MLKELEQFSYIGLRDNTALDIIKQVPNLTDITHLSFDLSYSINLNVKWNPKPSRSQSIIIPTDRHTLKHDSGINKLHLAETSKEWLFNKVNSYRKNMFIPFGSQDNDDYETCKQLAAGYKNSVVLEPNTVSLKTVARLMSQSICVYTYRLHGLILAHMIGVDYQFYPYHHKLKRTHETVCNLSPVIIKQKQQEIKRDVECQRF